MYRKDYLQRQFESFGKVLAALMGLRKNKDIETHEKELFSAFITYTQFKPEQIEAWSQEEFVKNLNLESTLSSAQLRMLADLIYEKLQLYLETGEEKKAKNLGLKCSHLYTLIQEDLTQNEFNLEAHYRLSVLETLKNQL